MPRFPQVEGERPRRRAGADAGVVAEVERLNARVGRKGPHSRAPVRHRAADPGARRGRGSGRSPQRPVLASQRSFDESSADRSRRRRRSGAGLLRFRGRFAGQIPAFRRIEKEAPNVRDHRIRR